MSSTARRLKRAAQRNAITTSLEVQGCRCRPDIVHTGPVNVRIEHDDDCPMIGRRQLIVALYDKRTCAR